MSRVVHLLAWLVVGQPLHWRKADPPQAPLPAVRFSMAPMPSRGNVVAIGHGGEMLLWDGSAWNPHSPAGGTLGWGRMAYDSARDCIVKVGWNGETSEWDGVRWTQRAIGPGASSIHFDVAYHDGIARTVWCGYRPPVFCGPCETFLWDGTAWTQHLGQAQPSGWQDMAYDRRRGSLLMYGASSKSPGGCVFREETWAFNGYQWTGAFTPGLGSRRFPCLGYDASLDAVILFGGYVGLSGLRDTWMWTGNSWQQLVVEGSPSARWDADLVYDQARLRLIAFGGDYHTWGPPNLETWLLFPRLVSATPATAPPGQNVAIAWNAPGEANRVFAMAASLGIVPGIPLPDRRVIPLNVDGLFAWSFLSQSPPFVGFFGRLDSSGRATANVLIPADGRLSGVPFFVGGVTVSGGSIARISNEERITIQ